MGRIINSPMPWKYPMPVRAIKDDDIFVLWGLLDKNDYDEMLRRFALENNLATEDLCPTSTKPSERK